VADPNDFFGDIGTPPPRTGDRAQPNLTARQRNDRRRAARGLAPMADDAWAERCRLATTYRDGEDDDERAAAFVALARIDAEGADSKPIGRVPEWVGAAGVRLARAAKETA